MSYLTTEENVVYRSLMFEKMEMQRDFSLKPGYIREKSDDEKAIHGLKVYFGEFTFDDHEVMKNNKGLTGKGVSVVLPSGKVYEATNQFDLFTTISEINKELGSFYDERYIEANFPDDYERLNSSRIAINNFKRDVVERYGESKKHDVHGEFRALDSHLKAEFKSQHVDSMIDSRSTSGSTNGGAGSVRGTNVPEYKGPLSQIKEGVSDSVSAFKQSIGSASQSLMDSKLAHKLQDYYAYAKRSGVKELFKDHMKKTINDVKDTVKNISVSEQLKSIIEKISQFIKNLFGDKPRQKSNSSMSL